MARLLQRCKQDTPKVLVDLTSVHVAQAAMNCICTMSAFLPDVIGSVSNLVQLQVGGTLQKMQ